MRIGYLVQSHKNVPQLTRLATALVSRDPDCVVQFCHDGRAEPDVAPLQRLPRTHVRLVQGGRGGYRNIDTWLTGVAELSARGRVDYVVTLSGQDYPVRPPAAMHAALRESTDGFLEAFPVFDERSHWPVREAVTRYRFRWSRVRSMRPETRRRLHWVQGVNLLQPVLRVNVSFDGLWIGIRSDGPPSDLTCWGGSMFTSLSWRAVEHIRSVMANRPDIVRWAKESLLIEEGLFPSILMSSGAFTFEPSSRRFYKFSRGNLGSPAFLTAADVADAVSSGAFFARKFDMDIDPEALDEADRAVLGSAA